MKRHCYLLFAVLFLTVSPSARADETLKGYVTEALANNPRVEAARLKWQEAEYKVRPAGTLPDPTLSYTHFGANVETRVGPQEAKYGMKQKVPFFGKLGLKEEAASKEAAVRKKQYEGVMLDLVREVKDCYFDIYWLNKALSVTREEKGVLENLEETATKRYETRQAPYQDAVKAQVEVNRMIDRLVMLEAARKSHVAHFNSLLSRKRDAEVVIGDVQPPDMDAKLEPLLEAAGEHRPEVEAADYKVEKASSEERLARLGFAPDMTVGFDYVEVGSGHTTAVNDGQDAWMASVAFTVPVWWGAIKDEVRAKEAARKASEQTALDTRNTVTFEVEDAYYKLKAYADITDLYETALIPQSRQAFEAAQKGYETGQADFLDWLESERVLLQTRLAYYRAVADFQKALAQLERVVGTPWRRSETKLSAEAS